jgi:predicted DNA-binding protein
MTRLTLRLPDEVHEKLRWLSYTERRSQQDIVLSILEKALEKVKVPKEGPK